MFCFKTGPSEKGVGNKRRKERTSGIIPLRHFDMEKESLVTTDYWSSSENDSRITRGSTHTCKQKRNKETQTRYVQMKVTMTQTEINTERREIQRDVKTNGNMTKQPWSSFQVREKYTQTETHTKKKNEDYPNKDSLFDTESIIETDIEFEYGVRKQEDYIQKAVKGGNPNQASQVKYISFSCAKPFLKESYIFLCSVLSLDLSSHLRRTSATFC